jgi:hypothetical protein
MLLKNSLTWALLCLFTTIAASCSFKSEQELPKASSDSVTGNAEMKIDPNADSDGDGVKDGEERASGRNPFVADLPELKVRFLQNYKIEVFYHHRLIDPVKDPSSVKSFVIDTNVKDTNPDFKYRVGNVFARKNALRTASSFGSFSSHSAGKFEEHDLSWVSYPELDPKFFHQKSLQHREVFSERNVIVNIKITLTNQVRLSESALFKEIKNLKLNFYYLNHETENYEVLSSTVVNRHFQSSVYETFEVVIDQAPVNLLKDSFFKRGEFLISEVEDYEIPSLGVNYKALLAKVLAKSIPVLLETPLEEKIYYVATEKGIHFQNMLKAVFDRNYEVKEDRLLKIGQFQNNLPDFTHLKEVKDKDKLGKWFVMTNEFKENYLDRRYTPSDRIILSYITGTELAEQQQENVYSYSGAISGNKSESIMPLGNITPNSQIDIQLKPLKRFGTTVANEKVNFSRSGPCGNNCAPRTMSCDWDVNKFTQYYEDLTFNPDLSGEAEKLSLLVNGEEFSVAKLLKEKKILLNKVDGNIHLAINDINKILELKTFEESVISLKVKSFVGNDFEGVKLVGRSGEWQGWNGCPYGTPIIAESRGTHISKDTLDLGEITWWVNDATRRGWTYPIKYLDSGPYYQEISLGVSSVIQNYYN